MCIYKYYNMYLFFKKKKNRKTSVCDLNTQTGIFIYFTVNLMAGKRR